MVAQRTRHAILVVRIVKFVPAGFTLLVICWDLVQESAIVAKYAPLFRPFQEIVRVEFTVIARIPAGDSHPDKPWSADLFFLAVDAEELELAA
jgi:hypothetical protein